MTEGNYKSVTINPCHSCMPIGGIIAFKGIEKSMVVLHGSQGCATYMRRHVAEHFNEPIDVGSSSLNEKGTIYGGEENLKKALDNVIMVYRPRVLGVLTTCLAETIGEDIDRVVADYRREKGLDFPLIVTVSTPGYGGTQSEGYWLTVKKIIVALAKKTARHSGVNILVPNISPADIREIKRILNLMQIEHTLVPDFSETLDRPFEKPYRKIPSGGTKIAAIAAMSGAQATIEFGLATDETFSPGRFLEEEFGVPLYRLPVPIGIENCDRFLAVLKEISGRDIPDELKKERGRLLDCMIDSHKYNSEGRSVVFGEPDLIFAVTRTCVENGITPVVIASGSRSSSLFRLLESLLIRRESQPVILQGTDFNEIRAKAVAMGANIAIGSSEGRYLTEKEGIPLVRIGFPIHDRVGGQRLLSVGYIGTALFLDRITNTLLERKLSNYRINLYRQFFRG